MGVRGCGIANSKAPIPAIRQSAICAALGCWRARESPEDPGRGSCALSARSPVGILEHAKLLEGFEA
eukprot:13597114-Alexandrium_andersonii.AAC.1